MKLKTNKSASKRITNVTRNGKIMIRTVSAQHLAGNKSKRTRTKAGSTFTMHKTDARKVKKMIPYR